MLFACVSTSLAERVAEIDDHLRPIVSSIAADPNAGGWTWETNRNGGYLLRTFMDVTGDGQPELFIATTLQGTRHKQSWKAFELSTNGAMRPYKGTLEYSSAWPLTEDGQTTLVYVSAPDKERLKKSDDSPYPVHRFSFTFPEIQETTSYVSEEEATKLNPDQLPKLESILLADYLTDPDAKWSEVTEWKLDGNDCFFREEDKERAAKNSVFTPQAALSRLGVVQTSSTSGRHPQPVEQPSAPKKLSDAQPSSTAPNEIPGSSTPWGVIIMGIALTIVLSWLLFKGRK